MKAITKLLFVALVSMLGFASCDKLNEVAPTIEITAVGTTENSIIFTVNAKGASKCAYILYDGDTMNADKVFADGVAIENPNGPVIAENLKSGTTYYVVAAAKNSVDTVLSNSISLTTKGDNTGGDNGGNNGGNQDDPNEGNGGNGGNNGGNNDNFELPEIDGCENIVITKTKDGRWYQDYNYYVTFVRDNGDRIILDFYTLDETMRQYFPYGVYTLNSNYAAYTIHPESSGYVPANASADGEGYNFTDAYVSVDVVNGQYAIYMMLTYNENGVDKNIQGYYNGILSGASIPAGDDVGSKKLIEVLDVTSSSFKFRINAEEGQYWRCSVVDKRVYNQTASNPGAWIVTYGMMLSGTLTFDWIDGQQCPYLPSLTMSVTSSTDYLIIAALMDYSEGQENSLLGGVEIVEVRTKGDAVGAGTVDITMKEINTNDVVFDCVFGDNVWCCYIAMMETSNLDEIKAGKYLQAGYSSFEQCMLSLIPGLSHDFMRQLIKTEYDYKFDSLKYGTSYTMCVKVVDMNNGATYLEFEPFVTNK